MTSTSSARRSVLAAVLAGVFAVLLPIGAQAADGGIDLSFLGGGHRLVGSGKVASETRAVNGFQAISLRASMKLVLRQGTREGIELRADDNVLPLIETQVVDRGGTPTLEFRFKKDTGFSTKNEIVATVDLVTLRALSIAGSGDVVADALKTPSLALAISGSGDVKVRRLAADALSIKVSGSGDVAFAGGRAAKLAVSISGSGDVDTHGMEADEVSVAVAGSGDANVNARKSLSVSIAGVGDVKYSGDAAVKSSIPGMAA